MKELLRSCLLKENPNAENIFYKMVPTASFEDFLDIISRKTYNLAKDLNLNTNKVSNLLTALLPNRPKTTSRIHRYLLELNDIRFCTKCGLKLDKHKDFYKNNNWCKTCQNSYFKNYYINNKESWQVYNAGSAVRLVKAIPKWADLLKIEEIYKNKPEGYHVDHIIPLKGKEVCGLHVENNLQYLTPFDNISKSNTFKEEYLLEATIAKEYKPVLNPNKKYCKVCSKKLQSRNITGYCREHLPRKEISIEDIEYWVKNYSWVRASKELGLTDNGLRKRYKTVTGRDPKNLAKEPIND